MNFSSIGHNDFSAGSWTVLSSLTTTAASGTNVRNPSASEFVYTDARTIVQGDHSFQIIGRWDSFKYLGDGNYTGTWHLDIPIVPGGGYLPGQPGSILYNLTDEAQVAGQGSGIAKASDPTGFASITLPDVGNVTPESLGVSLTFDSGIVSPNLQATATPEPATLTMLGIGAACMAGYGWRRRKQTVTA